MTFSFPLPVSLTLNQAWDIYSVSSTTFICFQAKQHSKQTFDNSVPQYTEHHQRTLIWIIRLSCVMTSTHANKQDRGCIWFPFSDITDKTNTSFEEQNNHPRLLYLCVCQKHASITTYRGRKKIFPPSAFRDVSRSPTEYGWSVSTIIFLLFYHLKWNQIRFSCLKPPRCPFRLVSMRVFIYSKTIIRTSNG